MGLIKNKIKKSSWLKGFAKKSAAVGLAGGIAFSSIFGFAGCDAKKIDAEADLPDNNIVSNEDAVTQESIDELKSMIDSIKGMVQSLGITDTAILTKIGEIEEKINALATDFSNKNAVIDEIVALIGDINEEIIAIKLRLGIIEEDMVSKEVIEEIINRLNVVENNQNSDNKDESNLISREEMDAVDNKIAKINARLAIEKSFDTNYMNVCFGEGHSAASSINGDVVIDRGVNDDYAYYNKDLDMTFASTDGEEFFIAGSKMSFDLAQMLTRQLLDEGFVLNGEYADNAGYAFVNEEGVTIAVNINSGLCTSARLTDNNNEHNDILIETSTYNNFKNKLSRCKHVLKSIGLFESFKKELDNSLDYKYKNVTATNKTADGVQTAICVYSSQFCAQEMIDEISGNKSYAVVKDSKVVNAVFDESNNLVGIDEFDDYSDHYSLDEEIKDMATANMYGADKNTITQDENGTYTIISEDENSNTKVNVTFNEDLSVDLKVYIAYNDEVFDVSYRVEKLTKTQFDETYNRILDIVELAKANQAGVTVE